jgi:phage tail sheath protein FI
VCSSDLALNFRGGWKAWGNYTACYPDNTDVKDYFVCVSRMFDWVGKTLIQTYWSRVDKPTNLRLVGTITDSVNIWLNGLYGAGYILGGRVEFRESENPVTDLMQGIIRFHVFLTPPSPAQEIDFVLEYDVNYLTQLFAA